MYDSLTRARSIVAEEGSPTVLHPFSSSSLAARRKVSSSLKKDASGMSNSKGGNAYRELSIGGRPWNDVTTLSMVKTWANRRRRSSETNVGVYDGDSASAWRPRKVIRETVSAWALQHARPAG